MNAWSWIDQDYLHKILAQAHSSVERAGLLGGVRFRQLEIDEKYRLHGDTLAEAIQKDKEQGLIPFYVSLQCDSSSPPLSHVIHVPSSGAFYSKTRSTVS
jgi:hypothetical protein